MEGVKSDYLEKVAKICLHQFNGVIPWDVLCQNGQLKKGDMYIINLDDSTQPGSHFVAFHVKEDNCPSAIGGEQIREDCCFFKYYPCL